MARHAAELSCCSTCDGVQGLALIPAVTGKFFLIKCCRPSKFGWIATDKYPGKLTLLKNVFIGKGGVLAEERIGKSWEICAKDGTNQIPLVNVSVFHHGTINNNYYKEPPGVLGFFPSFSLLPFIIKGRLSIFMDLVLLMVSLDFDS